MMKSEFLKVFSQQFLALAHTIIDDNYDHVRFPDSENLDQSKLFSVSNHAAYLNFFVEHIDDFYNAFLLLKDKESRNLFIRLILYRLLGHLHVRIRDEWKWSWYFSRYNDAQRLVTGDSTLDVSGIFGALKHYDSVPCFNKSLKVDCWSYNILASFMLKQYFLERKHIVVCPEPDDVVLDCGACFGETALLFATATGSKVHAFEPLSTHVRVCEYNIQQNDLYEQIKVYGVGVSDITRNLDKTFSEDNAGSPGFSILGREQDVPTVSIDDFVAYEQLDRCDFIKMDIEGSEWAALNGAMETIAYFQPKLAISIYHNPQDFFRIPQFFASYFPSYDLYLSHYTIHSEETILYASPRSGESLMNRGICDRIN